MSRFLIGDELGHIKTIRCNLHSGSSDAENSVPRTVYTDNADPVSKNAIQSLAVGSVQSNGSQLVAAGFSDGSASTFLLDKDDNFQVDRKWTEARLHAGQRYVGLAVSERGIFSCTSNGALRLTSLSNGSDPSLAALPTRLHDWRLSLNEETFAYGGEEVDLSVWNTEMAFMPRSETGTVVSKKRKRDIALLPGEIWRAKNVPNDFLGLRQPIRITSLTYLLPSATTHHLMTGMQLGGVRRYDTRSSRRPVSNWKIGKAGISVMERGMSEHEIFIGDHACNLFSVDLRNGCVIYRYPGLSGAVISLAPSPTVMVSSSLDRYTRLHSFFPPAQPGQRQEHKGQVLEKIYMKSIPTVVVWDQNEAIKGNDVPSSAIDHDDVWVTMEHVDDGSEVERTSRRRRRVVQ